MFFVFFITYKKKYGRLAKRNDECCMHEKNTFRPLNYNHFLHTDVIKENSYWHTFCAFLLLFCLLNVFLAHWHLLLLFFVFLTRFLRFAFFNNVGYWTENNTFLNLPTKRAASTLFSFLFFFIYGTIKNYDLNIFHVINSDFKSRF